MVFNDINKWSSSGIDGYQDFSCTDQTVVDPGITYNFFAETSAQFEEDLYVWIDYNNNGVLQGSEQVFQSQFALQNHGGTITIPTSGITYGVPLRMRVWSDFSQGLDFLIHVFNPNMGKLKTMQLSFKIQVLPQLPTLQQTPPKCVQEPFNSQIYLLVLLLHLVGSLATVEHPTLKTRVTHMLVQDFMMLVSPLPTAMAATR